MACFADSNVSQGSVATYARCGGIFNIHLTDNLPRNLPVKKILKSVKIWQKYGNEFVALLFGPPCRCGLLLQTEGRGLSVCVSFFLSFFLSVCLCVCLSVRWPHQSALQKRLEACWQYMNWTKLQFAITVLVPLQPITSWRWRARPMNASCNYVDLLQFSSVQFSSRAQTLPQV